MSRPARRLGAGVAALLCAALLAACGGTANDGTVVPPALRVGTATESGHPTTRPATGPGGLAVTAVGRDHGLLSVTVRNRGPREIVYARVRVTAVGRAGRTLLSTVGRRLSKATTIAGLPPGHDFGLVLTLPPGTRAVRSVRVAPVEETLAPWRGRHPVLRTGPAALTTDDGDAVVEARFTAAGPVTPYVSAQAFLVDPRHRLVAVVSGRFYCFADGTSRTLRLQLLHPVPAGTRVASVIGYPIPRRAPIPVPKACR